LKSQPEDEVAIEEEQEPNKWQMKCKMISRSHLDWAISV